MYTIQRLTGFNAFGYLSLTFPSFQPYLQTLIIGGNLVAIGAADGNRPIGLALAESRADGSAKILSILVQARDRRQGVGTALLTRLEQELHSYGSSTAAIVYAAGKPTNPALERLLQKCGWSAPAPHKLICRCTQSMQHAPWVSAYTLPQSFEIFSWTELTVAERQDLELQQKTQHWVPESLMPFKYEPSMEPLNSVGLRYRGQVVGWVITQRFRTDTICYSCSYIRPDLQRRGRIIPLYAEAIRRHCTRPEIPNATWVVPYIHEGMVQFVQHRMAAYMTSIDEFRRSLKSLDVTGRDSETERDRLSESAFTTAPLQIAGRV